MYQAEEHWLVRLCRVCILLVNLLAEQFDATYLACRCFRCWPLHKIVTHRLFHHLVHTGWRLHSLLHLRFSWLCAPFSLCSIALNDVTSRIGPAGCGRLRRSDSDLCTCRMSFPLLDIVSLHVWNHRLHSVTSFYVSDSDVGLLHVLQLSGWSMPCCLFAICWSRRLCTCLRLFGGWDWPSWEASPWSCCLLCQTRFCL